MTSRSAEELLLQALRDHDYPEDSLVLQPTFRASTGKTFAPDVVVVDPRTKDHLAVFETKKLPNAIGDAAARAIVDEYAASEGLGSEIPLYVYEIRSDSLSPVLYQLKGSSLEPLPAAEFPRYKALAAHRAASAKGSLAAETRETTDVLLVTSRWIAITAGAAFIADAVVERVWHWTLLTPARLAVAGVAILLLVLPHASKLKALGLEWERHVKGREGDG